MSWLSKLFGQKDKSEVEPEKPEDEQAESEEEPKNCEEETLAKKSTSKRSKQTTKASPSSDVAKSTYIPVPENDANLVAAHFGMLRPGGVAGGIIY